MFHWTVATVILFAIMDVQIDAKHNFFLIETAESGNGNNDFYGYGPDPSFGGYASTEEAPDGGETTSPTPGDGESTRPASVDGFAATEEAPVDSESTPPAPSDRFSATEETPVDGEPTPPAPVDGEFTPPAPGDGFSATEEAPVDGESTAPAPGDGFVATEEAPVGGESTPPAPSDGFAATEEALVDGEPTPPAPGDGFAAIEEAPVDSESTPPAPSDAFAATEEAPVDGEHTPPALGDGFAATEEAPVDGEFTPPAPGDGFSATEEAPVNGESTPPAPGDGFAATEEAPVDGEPTPSAPSNGFAATEEVPVDGEPTPPAPGNGFTATEEAPVDLESTPPAPGDGFAATEEAPIDGESTPPAPGNGFAATEEAPVDGESTPPTPGNGFAATEEAPVHGESTPHAPGDGFAAPGNGCESKPPAPSACESDPSGPGYESTAPAPSGESTTSDYEFCEFSGFNSSCQCGNIGDEGCFERAEYRGYDMNLASGVATACNRDKRSSAKECQALCSTRNGCNYFTWNRTNNQCTLKSSVCDKHYTYECGIMSGAKSCNDPMPDVRASEPGRPFIVQGKSRTTSSGKCSSGNGEDAESWKMGEMPSVLSSNLYNQEMGRYWLKNAEAEHASVASFARHTLQLMSIGAPSRLLIASQEASLDEIKHAKMCYRFASAFIGSDLGPGSLDVHGSLESMDLNGIVQSLIIEGCIGETLSAIEAHLAAHNAQDSAVKAAVSQIASDETKHAQLAWDTIKWIIEKYPDSRTFAEEIFHVELEQQMMPVRNDSSLLLVTLCEDAKDTTFRRYGLLVSEDREKVREAGIRNIIEPIHRAGFKGVDMISKHIKELDVVRLSK